MNYNQQVDRLKLIAATTTPTELIYDLMRLFGNVSETSINRIKSGKGNLAKEPDTVVAKYGKPLKVVAYRSATPEELSATLEELKSHPKAIRNKARLYIVFDGKRVMAYDPKEEETYENEIDVLYKDFDFFMPLAGIEKYQAATESEADVKAAYLMAKLYDDIRRYNDISTDKDIHSLNVFLSRLLFCFFAEDTDIFENELFTASIDRYTLPDGSDLQEYIEMAFDIMNIESPLVRADMPKIIHQFPYVNGGLFRHHHPVPNMSRRTRQLILKCGNSNWREINPDIFGSMIQAVIRPDQRAGLGLHYTSVPNILKLIGPLFLNSLWDAFANCREDEKNLRKLLLRLSKMKFFDPACGSGNFLIIAYKEVRKIEIAIWEQLQMLNQGQYILPFSNISLTQFYGIEIDEFAHETAILSLWIAEHQMNTLFRKKLGVHTDALPLRPGGQIAYGNACRLQWEEICPHTPEEEVYVMGNPPYLGSKLQNEEQKADMKIALAQIKNNQTVDYIAAWFWKAAIYIENHNAKAAFVTTNSICQGEQVAMLWKPIFDRNITISFAHTSFKWSNNAKYNAGVTCAIIGIEKNFKGNRILITAGKTRNVENINPYLAAGSNIIVQKTNIVPPKMPKMHFGCMPYDNGNLILSYAEKEEFISQYTGDTNLIKTLMGSLEFIRGEHRFCLWIPDEKRKEALKNPFISRRIEKTKEFRLNQCKDKKAGEELAKRAHQFREFIELTTSIIIPRVSSERREYIPIGLLDGNTVISDSAFAIYDAQVWLFGILTSKMHMAWIKTVGGRLKTDYRYSATLCYNTFPFPKITEEQRNEIESYAEEVLMVREEFTENTLAQLYDPDHMPQRLREAHRALDLAVERCYRAEPFGTDEERLEWLFKMYEKINKNK